MYFRGTWDMHRFSAENWKHTQTSTFLHKIYEYKEGKNNYQLTCIRAAVKRVKTITRSTHSLSIFVIYLWRYY